MKTAIHVSATVDQPDLLRNLVEKLAWKRSDDYIYNNEEEDRTLLHSSTTEAYVSGTMNVEGEGDDPEVIHMPFITCFLFTCVRADGQPYELAWSTCLS